MKVTKELCPVESFTEMLGGKWKLIIINTIRKKGVVRFGQLATSIPNISRKVLTDQLKSLHKNNLISRKQFQQIPPKVEYSLTKKADGLCSVFKTIEDWVNKS
jgi:DNA-binding HxlR family transcriptional regulator|tara:strand:- start:13 stop:321 length:309 start_codon:yes stop_codon:yes gene_type:complete